MKAYMYDVDNGLYEGEAYECEDLIKYVDGLTTIAPPSYDKGQVPVFNPNNRNWSLIPLSVMREQLRTSQARQEGKEHHDLINLER